MATTTMRAIETVFRGVRYRSRIEARWAVAYTVLGVPFEYEREGFNLEGVGLYLPDFWLPEQHCWIEIKGQKPTGEEQAKCAALAEASGTPVLLFPCAIPEIIDEENLHCPSDGCDGAYLFTPCGGGDNYYRWCVCPDCGKVGLTFDGRSDRLACKECFRCWWARAHPNDSARPCDQHVPGTSTGCPRQSSNGDKAYTPGHLKIKRAFDAARSARFEHGETGGVSR
jgi:hypothetical protein